eukprot:3915299-Heterocapsa_arctica.AAC.1
MAGTSCGCLDYILRGPLCKHGCAVLTLLVPDVDRTYSFGGSVAAPRRTASPAAVPTTIEFCQALTGARRDLRGATERARSADRLRGEVLAVRAQLA